MEKFLSKIQNTNYPFDRDTFHNVLRLYCNCRHVKNFEDILTYDKLNDYVYETLVNQEDTGSINESKEKNKYINKLYLDNNSIDSIQRDYAWLYATGSSKYNTKEPIKSHDIKHRFYICPSREDLYEFSSKLYDKFKDNDINFLFKTINCDVLMNRNYRKDAIVIYSDDDNLDDMVNALDEFSYENSGLIRRCHKPSVITMNVDNCDWLGYAKEEINDENKSYTANFALCFSKAIENFCKRYIKSNNMIITTEDRNNEKKNYDAKSFFEVSEYGVHSVYKYNYKLYTLSRRILISDSEARKELFQELISEMYMNNYDLNNFPVSKNLREKKFIKVKKPNE